MHPFWSTNENWATLEAQLALIAAVVLLICNEYLYPISILVSNPQSFNKAFLDNIPSNIVSICIIGLTVVSYFIRDYTITYIVGLH